MPNCSTPRTTITARIEPLLAKQFVTVDQVDQAKTAVTARQQTVEQQRSQVLLAEAQVQSALAQYEQAKAVVEQSHAQLGQSQHSVLTLDPLTAQREGRASAIRTAEYNLNNCKIVAPFDAPSDEPHNLERRLRPYRATSLHSD